MNWWEITDRFGYYSRISYSHHARRNVARHDGSRADQRSLSNADVRKNSSTDTDLSAGSNNGSSHHRSGRFDAGIEVVRNRDAWSQKRSGTNGCELRNVTVAVDLDVVGNVAPVVDDAVAPDRYVVAKDALFSDDDVVACGEIVTDL